MGLKRQGADVDVRRIAEREAAMKEKVAALEVEEEKRRFKVSWVLKRGG
jgi:hypothetical protein